jgi:hypothetical protein
MAIGAFAAVVALALLGVGPFVMRHVFGQPFAYGRVGLALVGVGMGLHLLAGTLNQAALARRQAGAAAAAWLGTAALFVIWMIVPAVDNELLRAEVGYFGATAVLCAALAALYRSGSREGRPQEAPAASAISR